MKKVIKASLLLVLILLVLFTSAYSYWLNKVIMPSLRMSVYEQTNHQKFSLSPLPDVVTSDKGPTISKEDIDANKDLISASIQANAAFIGACVALIGGLITGVAIYYSSSGLIEQREHERKASEETFRKDFIDRFKNNQSISNIKCILEAISDNSDYLPNVVLEIFGDVSNRQTDKGDTFLQGKKQVQLTASIPTIILSLVQDDSELPEQQKVIEGLFSTTISKSVQNKIAYDLDEFCEYFVIAAQLYIDHLIVVENKRRKEHRDMTMWWYSVDLKYLSSLLLLGNNDYDAFAMNMHSEPFTKVRGEMLKSSNHDLVLNHYEVCDKDDAISVRVQHGARFALFNCLSRYLHNKNPFLFLLNKAIQDRIIVEDATKITLDTQTCNERRIARYQTRAYINVYYPKVLQLASAIVMYHLMKSESDRKDKVVVYDFPKQLKIDTIDYKKSFSDFMYNRFDL